MEITIKLIIIYKKNILLSLKCQNCLMEQFSKIYYFQVFCHKKTLEKKKAKMFHLIVEL